MESQIKVLLVDDNSCLLWGLRHLIDGQKPAMAVADTVSRRGDVTAAMRQHSPDVVLLDMELEGQPSVDMIGQIRECCPVRMIIFTAIRDAALHQNAILAGAHGLVFKSEPVDTVLRAIRAVHAGELWLRREMTAKIIGMMAASQRRAPTDAASCLFTPSEKRVIAAAVEYRGAPNKIIADVLHMSPNTFRNHLSAIYVKLGIHRRLDLVLYGIQHGIEHHPEDVRGDGNAVVNTVPIMATTPAGVGKIGGVAVAQRADGARQDMRNAFQGSAARVPAERPDARCIDPLGHDPLFRPRPGISTPGQLQGSAPVRLIKASLRTAATSTTRR